MEHLEPRLRDARSGRKRKGRFLLATVQATLTTSENIVALMLRNHGFQVVDLGKDVAAEAILKAVRRHKHRSWALGTHDHDDGPHAEVIRLAGKRLAVPVHTGRRRGHQSLRESLGFLCRDGVDAVKTIEGML